MSSTAMLSLPTYSDVVAAAGRIAGKRVGVIVSGGNVDLARYGAWLAG
ncbi:hypothetical protein GWC77_17015 [Paraburkholderia sp. NMBU_R16]|nr:hypothetical protein [Paraburkholderia sp. NMBU_R16]NRO97625.1 hypothetical protein [Paraburkholderia sp. NMBU_R16]